MRRAFNSKVMQEKIFIGKLVLWFSIRMCKITWSSCSQPNNWLKFQCNYVSLIHTAGIEDLMLFNSWLFVFISFSVEFVWPMSLTTLWPTKNPWPQLQSQSHQSISLHFFFYHLYHFVFNSKACERYSIIS